MPDDDQPTIPTVRPQGSRASASGMWQAPSVEQMQAVLPQYEVLEILGRGGMGAVYKARQRSLKRLVAIKILPLEAADDELKFAERFQNEAQTMAAMNHPAIVSVHDFGETTDGLLYFVMEFVDGTDVQQLLQASGKLTGDHALSITAHVCDALDYAHKRGVIHRDIKPANILIDQEGHIKVADFGLAKMSDPSVTSGLTRSNVAMGTPDYVAPEVLTTGMVADHRADLYAVGVMLYQMLTGEVPRGMFKLPSQKGIGSDPRFDEIICKAMETDREERYQSAGDVRQALEAIRTTTLAKKVVSALAESGDARLRLKSKLLYAAVAVVLLVAMFFILGDKPKPSAGPASTATALPSIAQGKAINLLPLVDVKRDTVAGEWSRDGGDLLVKAAKPDANGTPRSNASWNDWLGPKLATGTFGPPDWKVEKDGLTSEKPISGRNILTGEIRDAALRVSYDLRDSGGIQVAMREHRSNPNGRELYVADDTGVSLYISRMMPDGTIKKLVNRNYPSQTPRAATRTLEFCCVGDTLTATVTGATTEPFVVTATDTALQSGPVSVALKKGVLLKKVETQILDTPR